MAVNLSGKAKATEKADTKKKIEYTVLEECGTLDSKEYTQGGEPVREILMLRYVKWSKGEARYDLRWWIYRGEEEIPGKGIGMTGEALIALGDKIKEMQEDKPAKKKSVACGVKRNPTCTSKPVKTASKTTKAKK